MKITATALRTNAKTGEKQTTFSFTDGKFSYEVTVDGDLTNPERLYIVEAGFLRTLTEYELIESMTDEKAKAARLGALELDEERRAA